MQDKGLESDMTGFQTEAGGVADAVYGLGCCSVDIFTLELGDSLKQLRPSNIRRKPLASRQEVQCQDQAWQWPRHHHALQFPC